MSFRPSLISSFPQKTLSLSRTDYEIYKMLWDTGIATVDACICCECTPALSTILFVWINGFPQCTHICSFSRFCPYLCGFPPVFPLASFLVCFVCACSWETWLASRPLGESFLYSGVWRRTYAREKFSVNEIYPVWIIYLCILVKDI